MTQVSIERITDVVMAHEGIAASLDAKRGVLGEDLAAAVERLIPLAAAAAGARFGAKVTVIDGMITVDGDHDALLIEAAITGLTLAMITPDGDGASMAEQAIAAINAGHPAPGHRTSTWW